MKRLRWVSGLCLASLCAGCGSDDGDGSANTGLDGNPDGSANLGTGGTNPGTGGATNPGTGGATNPGAGGTTNPGAGGTTNTGTGGVTNPGTGGAPVTGGVEVSGLACGGVLDANLLPPFVDIGGRQVFIDYACGKPAGTPVTFILNLHGTMDLEAGKIYQRGYFPAYNYIDSHDFIIATPKSVVSQWGNMDGGQDEPHLMAVIDWVYDSFAAFDIQQMWVVGHSWGAFYARTFACKPELEDKVHGVVLMSGGSGVPACADRLAMLGTVGETDIVPGELDQGATAAAHGCGSQTTRNLGNNVVTEWPNCQPGWVHRNYFMLGKGHGFDPADWPDQEMTVDLVEAIAGTR